MILVTVGSERYPFDRLIQAVDNLAYRGVLQEVFCQTGQSHYQPEHCLWKSFIPFSEMLEHIRSSDLIIAHGGAGITLLCLQEGKIPVLVPRRRRWGEHVDDHQMEFAARLDRLLVHLDPCDDWDMRWLEDHLIVATLTEPRGNP